jgi:molecular chaperone HscB
MQATAANDGCWRCAGPTQGGLVCPQCQAPQALGADADLFAVLGLTRRLAVDVADLEQRWHHVSRAVHPDRHQTAGDRDRELSLAASAAANRAYRTLREPIALGRYWLELHGRPLGQDNNRVPAALAAEVFETQERLEELREAEPAVRRREAQELHDALDARLVALTAALRESYVAWDAGDPSAPAVLDELKTRLSEIAYLRTLRDDVAEVAEAEA